MNTLENGMIITLVNSDGSGSNEYKLLESFESDGAVYCALVPNIELPDSVESITFKLTITKLIQDDDEDKPHMEPIEDQDEADWAINEFSKTLDGITKN